MTDWTLLIPGVKLESLNRDLRGTTVGARMAAADRAKGQRTGTATMCWAKFGTPPPAPLTITITRVAPAELDTDNLAASAKHVRDGVSDWLGINDKDKRLQWRYEQEKQGKGVYGVKVRVQTRLLTLDELLACDKLYQELVKKSLKLSEARAKLEPGTSRARVTTANARWARAAEARDLRERELRMQWEGAA